MTPEGRVKQLVKTVLLAWPETYVHMPVQNGMGAPTLDMIGTHRGLYFAIETKKPGETFTKRQVATAKKILKANGAVFLIDGMATDHISFREFIDWLKNPRPGYLGLHTATHMAKQLQEIENDEADDVRS